MSRAPLTPSDVSPAEVLIYAPGRDGELSCRVLRQSGRNCHRCRDEAEVRARLGMDTGTVLMAVELLTASLARSLQDWVHDQPPWSDLPLIVVAQEGRETAHLQTLGNVTVLTRPMAVSDLTTAVASALRARGRQFQVRQLLEQQRAEARRKDDFLAMLAHELRNPLAPVRYAAHAIGMEAASERARRLALVIERQVGHMGRIIAQLLDVSRLTRGKIELERAPMDLAQLARRCVDAHQDAAATRGVRLRLDAPSAVWIDGDETRLGQVVENLLDNAIKFSRSGGEVTLEVAGDGGRARLVVSDQGDGIPQDDLPFVFEPFVQADRSLDRARGGLGLGLAMVKGLVELHGGSVGVDSAGPGLGSRFRVELPLAEPAATPPEPAHACAPEPGHLRVLVAEDNEDAAEMFRMLLELSGHAVSLATTGPDAVKLAQALRPDAVLCDIGLPGFSGYEVARQLRADPALRDTLMIAITGYGTAEDHAAAKAAGFDHHFPKPVDPQQVFAELARRRSRARG